MTQTTAKCLLCDAEAYYDLDYNEPDRSVGYRGGGIVEAMKCSEGHTLDDVREAGKMCEADCLADELMQGEMEAAEDAYWDSKIEDRYWDDKEDY